MKTLTYILLFLGAVLFFSAYLLHPWLWTDAFYQLTALGVVPYLLMGSIMAYKLKWYKIEIISIIFAFCQTLQYFDELNRANLSTGYLEIFLPISVTILLLFKHYKK